jgi:hypothetical protein
MVTKFPIADPDTNDVRTMQQFEETPDWLYAT